MKWLGTQVGHEVGKALGSFNRDDLGARIRNAAFSNFRADSYTVDGSSGKVASFTELSTNPSGIASITPSHAMAQATAASQVPIPVTASIFGNQVAATFSVHNYVSSSPASSWTFANDGTGMTIYMVLSWDMLSGTQHVLNTCPNGANIGFTIASAGAGGDLLACTINSSAEIIASAASSGSALVASTPYYIRFSYVEGGTPNEVRALLDTSVQASLDTTGAPSLTAPSNTLRLGNRTAGSQFLGKWCETLVFKGPFSATTDALVLSYFLARYGIA